MLKAIFGALTIALLLSSCTPEPQAINFGTDICHFCKMTIVDQRFGAELVTNKGKVYKFDATECLVNAVYKDEIVSSDNVHSLWVVSYDHPKQLIKAKDAVYLHSKNLPSPMGMFLTAFCKPDMLNKTHQQKKGRKLAWADVKNVVIQNLQPPQN